MMLKEYQLNTNIFLAIIVAIDPPKLRNIVINTSDISISTMYCINLIINIVYECVGKITYLLSSVCCNKLIDIYL